MVPSASIRLGAVRSVNSLSAAPTAHTMREALPIAGIIESGSVISRGTMVSLLSCSLVKASVSSAKSMYLLAFSMLRAPALTL